MLVIRDNRVDISSIFDTTPVIENYDLHEDFHEVELESANLEFDIVHSMLENYIEVLDDPSIVREDSSGENKGIWQKIKDFVKRIWEKLKEMGRKFINWITGKGESVEDFLTKYKGAKLGKITREAPDFELGFKNVLASDELAKKIMGILNKMHQTKADFIPDNPDEEKLKDLMFDWFENGKLKDDRTVQSVADSYIKDMYPDVKERELDGNKLFDILSQNKDIAKKLTDIQKTYEKALKEIDKAATDKMFEFQIQDKSKIRYYEIMVYWMSQLCAKLSTGTFAQAQKLISSLRGIIAACARLSD